MGIFAMSVEQEKPDKIQNETACDRQEKDSLL